MGVLPASQESSSLSWGEAAAMVLLGDSAELCTEQGIHPGGPVSVRPCTFSNSPRPPSLPGQSLADI